MILTTYYLLIINRLFYMIKININTFEKKLNLFLFKIKFKNKESAI